jgi:hypothetical protein
MGRIVKKVFALFLLFFIFLEGNIRATTYYIDADSGANENAGTIEAPWQTGIQVALSPGDTVYYKKGTTATYGPIIYSWSGTTGNLITISTYSTGAQPKILPAGQIITGWTGPDGNGVYSKSITIADTGFLEDYHNLGPAAADATCATGNWYNDTINHVLYYKPTTGTPGAVIVLTGGYTAYPSGSAGVGSYVTYDGLHFIGLNFYYTATGAEYVTFQNCTFSDIGGQATALMFYSAEGALVHDITIDRCTFEYNANNLYFVRLLGAAAYFDSLTVSNNTMSYIGTTRHNGYYKDLTGYGASWDNDGISAQNVQNSVFEHNEIAYGSCSRTAGINLWYDGAGPGAGVVIRYNYIHDLAHGDGINWGGSDVNTANAQIYYNVIANCATVAGNPGYTYGGGINLHRAQTTGTRTNVYNNTIVNCPYGIWISNATDYFNIRNNLIVNSTSYAVASEGAINANMTIDYNGYNPVAGNVFSIAGTPTSYATWKESYDASSVSVTPNVVSTTDFHLQSNSPAINAGVNVSLTTDYAGRAVPYGAGYDIGAYEFGEGSIMKIGTGAAPKIGVGSAITVY